MNRIIRSIFAVLMCMQLGFGADASATTVFGKLMNIPHQPLAANEAHNRALQERVARATIQAFALQLSGRTQGTVTAEDTCKAVNALEVAAREFADTNKDGKTSAEEWEALMAQKSSKPGLETLFEMKLRCP